MQLDEMIRSNPDINLTIQAGELAAFGQNIADQAVKTFIENKDEKVYTRAEVLEKFKICPATLWRWEKISLIKGKKIGNRVYYLESEIKRLTSQKGGDQ